MRFDCVYKVFVMVGWLVADNAGKIDKYAFKCRVRLTQLQYLRTSYKDMKDIQFCCRYFWYTYLVMGQGQCERWTKWFDGWIYKWYWCQIWSDCYHPDISRSIRTEIMEWSAGSRNDFHFGNF